LSKLPAAKILTKDDKEEPELKMKEKEKKSVGIRTHARAKLKHPGHVVGVPVRAAPHASTTLNQRCG